jgi:hypothetical protein
MFRRINHDAGLEWGKTGMAVVVGLLGVVSGLVCQIHNTCFSNQMSKSLY